MLEVRGHSGGNGGGARGVVNELMEGEKQEGDGAAGGMGLIKLI